MKTLFILMPLYSAHESVLGMFHNMLNMISFQSNLLDVIYSYVPGNFILCSHRVEDTVPFRRDFLIFKTWELIINEIDTCLCTAVT